MLIGAATPTGGICNGMPNQRWMLNAVQPGVFNIMSVPNTKCIIRSGNVIVLGACASRDTNALWKFV